MPRTSELLDFWDKFPERTPQKPCLPHDAVKVFESYNYQVASLGWDPVLDLARRTLR